ncbi:MAG: hypothetical protein ACMV0I_09345 [Pseudomonas sp.]
MTTTIKKFTLKFNLTTDRPSASCDAVGFFAELLGSAKGYETHAKERLINSFIREQEFKTQTKNLWSYEMKAKNDTVTVLATPKITFLPLEGDLEAMQGALTQAKISASFFDNQISKHLDTVGIKTTRANIRVYRKSYIAQISKLLSKKS